MNRARLLLAAGGALAVLVGAHVALVRSGSMCPMMKPATPAALEAQRQRALPELRGTGLSPSNDAFGFPLGTTTREAFSKANESCATELEGALVRCEGAQGEIVARFDPKGMLVGADRVKLVEGVEEGSALYRALSSAETARLGTPTRAWGNDSPAFLAEPLRQVGVAYRFEDVAVDLSLTHLGPGRIALREQVRAIPRAVRGG